MQETPRFKVGDGVRVMQVPDMERKGFANLHGEVVEIHPATDSIQEWARVAVVSDKLKHIQVPTCSLMRNAPRNIR